MEVWKRLKNLFKAAEKSSPQHPFEHKIIERTEEELEAYALWKNSEEHYAILDWLQLEYATFCTAPQELDAQIDFLRIPSVNGFVMHYDCQCWDSEHFVFLFDWLKERIEQLGYWPHLSDLSSYKRHGKVESVQRHYLKPPRNFNVDYGTPLDQVYGNIMITLLFRNERIVNLKFSATHYNDRKYKAPEPFENLIDILCEHA